MSAEQSSPTALPPVGQSDGKSVQATSGEVPQVHDLSAAGESPIATAELANLLAHGQWGDTAYGVSADGNHSYDGHVALALALDTGDLPDIDSTLDLLTSSHHLFDVPALDVSAADDASST